MSNYSLSQALGKVAQQNSKPQREATAVQAPQHQHIQAAQPQRPANGLSAVPRQNSHSSQSSVSPSLARLANGTTASDQPLLPSAPIVIASCSSQPIVAASSSVVGQHQVKIKAYGVSSSLTNPAPTISSPGHVNGLVVRAGHGKLSQQLHVLQPAAPISSSAVVTSAQVQLVPSSVAAADSTSSSSSSVDVLTRVQSVLKLHGAASPAPAPLTVAVAPTNGITLSEILKNIGVGQQRQIASALRPVITASASAGVGLRPGRQAQLGPIQTALGGRLTRPTLVRAPLPVGAGGGPTLSVIQPEHLPAELRSRLLAAAPGQGTTVQIRPQALAGLVRQPTPGQQQQTIILDRSFPSASDQPVTPPTGKNTPTIVENMLHSTSALSTHNTTHCSSTAVSGSKTSSLPKQLQRSTVTLEDQDEVEILTDSISKHLKPVVGVKHSMPSYGTHTTKELPASGAAITPNGMEG